MGDGNGRLLGAAAGLALAHGEVAVAGTDDLWNGVLPGQWRMLLYGSLV